MAALGPRLSSSVRHRWRTLTTDPKSGLPPQAQPQRGLGRRLLHRADSSAKVYSSPLAHDETDQTVSGLKGLRKRRSPYSREPRNFTVTSILGQSIDLPIRTRFAPSPTGYLHLGSLRTALFNILAARASKGGAFILRIKDTDRSRLVKDAEQRIIQDLKWAGLSWDEGPDCGGPHGPYRQSERLPIYRQHVQRLVDAGHAYRCFCTAEQLESQKRLFHEAGQPAVYPGTCRSIAAPESDRRSAAGEPHVVRFKGNVFGSPKLDDAIYGHIQKKKPEEDFVILKTDGFPTYHLANVVDDHLMDITHVIRGEEWLISTPKHLVLYRAFGWRPPTFAHLGLLVNADGTKLSKRTDSVDISKYRRDRIFPIAFLSWLANLGSSFKSGIKIPLNMTDLVNAMTFKFTTGGIRMNFEKLEHFHNKYQNALMTCSCSDMGKNEAQAIKHHLIQPLLCQVDAVTRGHDRESRRLPVKWQTSLELVPALGSGDKPDKARNEYARNIFVATQGGRYNSPSSLIAAYPFLFWRVPAKLYKSSLGFAKPRLHVLDALDQAIEKTDLWDGQGHRVMEFLDDMARDSGVEPAILHNVLRLVATGDWDMVTPSSPKMFALLGREEWRFRHDALKALLGLASVESLESLPAATVG